MCRNGNTAETRTAHHGCLALKNPAALLASAMQLVLERLQQECRTNVSSCFIISVLM
jgi:hypothetical protein